HCLSRCLVRHLTRLRCLRQQQAGRGCVSDAPGLLQRAHHDGVAVGARRDRRVLHRPPDRHDRRASVVQGHQGRLRHPRDHGAPRGRCLRHRCRMHDVHRHEVTRGHTVARGRLGIAALVGSLAPLMGVARADHDMAMSHDHDASEISVGVSAEAAGLNTTYYVGSYQGITPSLGWMYSWFGASAMISLYHLTENGLSIYGRGDAMLAAHATVIETDTVHGGVALHVMLPTGSDLEGLGMGHVMAMP